MNRLLIALLSTTLLMGCADKVPLNQLVSHEIVGFFHGIWHGWIIGWAFLISLFTDDVAIYAFYNNGSWYDFGYILGVGVFGGTSSIINRR